MSLSAQSSVWFTQGFYCLFFLLMAIYFTFFILFLDFSGQIMICTDIVLKKFKPCLSVGELTLTLGSFLTCWGFNYRQALSIPCMCVKFSIICAGLDNL